MTQYFCVTIEFCYARTRYNDPYCVEVLLHYTTFTVTYKVARVSLYESGGGGCSTWPSVIYVCLNNFLIITETLGGSSVTSASRSGGTDNYTCNVNTDIYSRVCGRCQKLILQIFPVEKCIILAFNIWRNSMQSFVGYL